MIKLLIKWCHITVCVIQLQKLVLAWKDWHDLVLRTGGQPNWSYSWGLFLLLTTFLSMRNLLTELNMFSFNLWMSCLSIWETTRFLGRIFIPIGTLKHNSIIASASQVIKTVVCCLRSPFVMFKPFLVYFEGFLMSKPSAITNIFKSCLCNW